MQTMECSTATGAPASGFVADIDDLVVVRDRLRNTPGLDYSAFRKTLSPAFGRVRRDILLGYAGTALVLVAVSLVPGLLPALIAAAFGAIGIGLAVAYLQLFLHEAAHFNLARDRRVNDAMADWLIAWQVGTTIDAYRRIHSEHHRFLGEAGDTEISYRNRLTVRFFFEMLTGIHAIRVFFSRQGAQPRSSSGKSGLIRGVVLHVTLIASLVMLGAWPAALAWIIGIGSVYPVLATVRQLLEHRPAAGNRLGGAVSRLFADGPFACIFGGAGFNRHLLHHLEPQISYTRLAEYEAFISDAGLAAWIDERRTTYHACFRQMLKEGRLA